MYFKTITRFPIATDYERCAFQFIPKISDMIKDKFAYFAIGDIFPNSFINLIVIKKTIRVMNKLSQNFKLYPCQRDFCSSAEYLSPTKIDFIISKGYAD